MHTMKIPKNQKKYSRTTLEHFNISIRKIQKSKKRINKSFPFSESSKREKSKRKEI
jgi:hypothetical protein